jgi:murein DD-endopeptidase MepM/ murein hydrolase activator NlpD
VDKHSVSLCIVDDTWGNSPESSGRYHSRPVDRSAERHCTPGSDARAIFEGIVVSVTPISNTNQAVIIRHGEFFTVYSNLEDVYVKRGDQVKTKEVIGRIHTDKKEAKTEVHFELWKGRQIQDPAGWLAR